MVQLYNKFSSEQTYVPQSAIFSLQIDFEALTRATGIATQGRYDAEQWVKTYRLTYSRDGSTYKYYAERRVIKVICVSGDTQRNVLTI